MLKKLLKYDLKSIYKFLIIFYCLSLFFAVLTRVLFKIENSFIMNIIAQVSSGITIAMMFNILINNLMRLWVRFKQNLYGDESYLTHTLPVDRKTLYVSKIITSIITLFTSVLVIGVSLFIAYYSKDNLDLLKNLLLPVINSMDSTFIKIVLIFFFIFFIEFVNVLQAGFTGIILGHRMNNGKTLYSVLFGFITYMIIQVIGFLMIFLVALFNKDLMNLFFTNEIVDIELLKVIIILSISIYTVTFIVDYVVNVRLFKKGVNVD